jgi:hypothetical protein
MRKKEEGSRKQSNEEVGRVEKNKRIEREGTRRTIAGDD